VGWFELFLQDENKPPKDRIIPLNEIIGLPIFEEAIKKGLNKLKL
jgi:hypothetical protein